MHVRNDLFRGNLLIEREFNLLADSGHAVVDAFRHGDATQLEREQRLQVSRILLQGQIDDVLRETDEVGILGHEVGFTVQDGHDAGLAVGRNLGQHTTFGGRAVRPLVGDQLSFLTDNLDGLFRIAIGFDQRLLAIHHAGTGQFSQFCYISCCYCHMSMFFLF